MTNYASGRYTWRVCDICGFTYMYDETTYSSYNTVRCPYCDDGAFDLKNHPQNWPPPVVADPIAVKDPRPDVNLDVTYDPLDGDEMTPLYVGGGGP